MLLRSGDDPIAFRVGAVASALERIATTLDHVSSDRTAVKAEVIISLRQSIIKASMALDRLEKLRRS